MTQLTALQVKQLAVLQRDYPGWHIAYDPGRACWIATRPEPPTSREHAAGIRRYLIRFSPERLVARLGEYIEQTHQLRGGRHTFTTSKH
ncbi:hypothetical protein OG339_47790 (plasmid) [Streptosporangium sp. NBC_01495]|uniref:hypothetical protein n=1 Tax=Streptosporangium sp. NBC_01495 TaxID=2903899 RepID=UPI002E33CE98|nr:hypothetical protein [Streptosporangium sp. NBC_01495]